MPRSRESVIAELDSRQVGYDDKMSYQELFALIEKDKAEKRAKEKPEAPKVEKVAEKELEKPIEVDYSGIMCGLSTIEGLHRRITILEHKFDAKG